MLPAEKKVVAFGGKATPQLICTGQATEGIHVPHSLPIPSSIPRFQTPPQRPHISPKWCSSFHLLTLPPVLAEGPSPSPSPATTLPTPETASRDFRKAFSAIQRGKSISLLRSQRQPVFWSRKQLVWPVSAMRLRIKPRTLGYI